MHHWIIIRHNGLYHNHKFHPWRPHKGVHPTVMDLVVNVHLMALRIGLQTNHPFVPYALLSHLYMMKDIHFNPSVYDVKQRWNRRKGRIHKHQVHSCISHKEGMPHSSIIQI